MFPGVCTNYSPERPILSCAFVIYAGMLISIGNDNFTDCQSVAQEYTKHYKELILTKDGFVFDQDFFIGREIFGIK